MAAPAAAAVPAAVPAAAPAAVPAAVAAAAAVPAAAVAAVAAVAAAMAAAAARCRSEPAAETKAAPPAIRFFAFRWELSLQSGGEHDGCWLTNAIQFLEETPAGASPESYLSSVPYLLPKKLKQFMV